ncbi:maleylpyruvate isomerase family mycothiol-dependent enzyme [Nocardioides agariphilus]|uniref:maleylpyruvate isomerase family mycothiol-dependent enzyme n=1 Tax=Nocardioides agariphilus TaxID=433664 RepID=UPI00351FD873
MPTSLTIDQHLGALRDAVSAFARHADRAGLDVPVPTCPEWTVRRLIGHQGMVHRWATANLRGQSIEIDATERAGRRASSPVDWLRDGALHLVAAITDAPDDVHTIVFLNDAPAPREFWARRQCHETTIHAVDALSAELGRYPRSGDTWIDPAVAVDGIDELLRGFMTRNKSRLRSEEPITIGVLADEAPSGWLVEVSPAPAVVTLGARDEVAERADVRLSGPAVAVYLTLWNRSDELDLDDPAREPWRAAGIQW